MATINKVLVINLLLQEYPENKMHNTFTIEEKKLILENIKKFDEYMLNCDCFNGMYVSYTDINKEEVEKELSNFENYTEPYVKKVCKKIIKDFKVYLNKKEKVSKEFSSNIDPVTRTISETESRLFPLNKEPEKPKLLVFNLSLDKTDDKLETFTVEEKRFILNNDNEFNEYLKLIKTEEYSYYIKRTSTYSNIEDLSKDYDILEDVETTVRCRDILASFRTWLNKDRAINLNMECKINSEKVKVMFLNLTKSFLTGNTIDNQMVTVPIDDALRDYIDILSTNGALIQEIMGTIKNKHNVIIIPLLRCYDITNIYKAYKYRSIEYVCQTDLEKVLYNDIKSIIDNFIKVNNKPLSTTSLNKEQINNKDTLEVNVLNLKDTYKLDRYTVSKSESISRKLNLRFIEVDINGIIYLLMYSDINRLDDTLYEIVTNKENKDLLITNAQVDFTFKRDSDLIVHKIHTNTSFRVRYKKINTLEEALDILEELHSYNSSAPVKQIHTPFPGTNSIYQEQLNFRNS